ncbi:MAG: A/G-specific adenine glycosylase [Tannerellaceae bacterium]|nr:A/G-specific adenine glycosylase [Tannerellaceae bacterium]
MSDYTISDQLVNWYQINKRDLPWRNVTDAYKIWISEIILQQTRVVQGMDYYYRFIERFPDVRSLASAPEDEVLKYWQGLGYYSRARNLHATAKIIVEKYSGQFPQKYKDVLSLKGIGEYTAAAIVSFVWNQPYPAVDGNVFRVLSRLFGVEIPIDTGKGKKEFTELAGEIMNPENAALHNQAIMEFGALQCIPQNPDCAVCPLNTICVAYREKKISQLPVKQNKTKTRDRFFHYFHVMENGITWLNRRTEKDIWQGLYELPLIETPKSMDFVQLQQTKEFRSLFGNLKTLKITPVLTTIKHVLSHQIIYAVFYRVESAGGLAMPQNFLKINSGEIGNFAVSRLVEIYLEKGSQLSFDYTV